MAEQFANMAATILEADLPIGPDLLVVQSPGAFPESPQFRIRIGGELLLVTAVDGANWTVTRAIEGTTEEVHPAGSLVQQVLTAGALYAISTASGATVYGPPLTTGNLGYMVNSAPLTNGDVADPQIVFDAQGQVVMVGDRVASELVFDALGQVILTAV